MKLPITLAWLLDEASTADSADHFLAALGAQLIADDLPLAGGALTLAAPHPMIARRTWLWRAGNRGGVRGPGFLGFCRAGPQPNDPGPPVPNGPGGGGRGACPGPFSYTSARCAC